MISYSKASKKTYEEAHLVANPTDNGLKKRIIIILIVIVCIIPILLGAIYAINLYAKTKNKTPEVTINYNWYPADFNENIFEDEEYMKLIEYEFISYTEGSVTQIIDKETANIYGKDVSFMVDYLYSIVEGDADKYNSYFSEEYYKSANKKDAFTMQKIYDVELRKQSLEKVEEKGNTYTKCTFVLSYRILENNGTFRKDIGEGSREQYITLTNRNGEFLIDSISVPQVIVQK